MEILLVVIYGLALTFIFIFSMVQLHLTLKYRKARKSVSVIKEMKNSWPHVTVQLPVYNEKYVVIRLIKAIAELDYPKDKLEIQLLDDSTDETSEIIRNEIKGIDLDIQHIQRVDRKGFKAGALQAGLEVAKGEFIAIFDADFVPNKDFLNKLLPLFDDNVGLVRLDGGHINKNYSLLTKLQAFGLDAHFTIEQSGRQASNSFISFNGTGGVWRKSCITDAGGWSSDTLTEDLDLSYRAQLKGWKFEFLEDYEAPAELPIIMPAIKSQQYRWNKGAAETAKKILPSIIRSKLPFINKLHATFHLLNSSVFIFILLTALLSVPMLFVKSNNPSLNWFFIVGSIFLLGFFSIGYFYFIASKSRTIALSSKSFFSLFPLFLMVSMGLSLHNGLAVFSGLLGRKTPFIRTPKFGVKNKKDKWRGNTYIKLQLTPLTLFEGLHSLYFIYGIWIGISLGDFGLILFHSMLALGFAMVFFYSINPFKNA